MRGETHSAKANQSVSQKAAVKAEDALMLVEKLLGVFKSSRRRQRDTALFVILTSVLDLILCDELFEEAHSLCHCYLGIALAAVSIVRKEHT